MKFTRILGDSSPMIVFYGINWVWGLKPAVAGAVLYCTGEIIYKKIKKIPLSKIFIYSAVMTLAFGAVDLMSKEPWLIKYEAAVSNILTGGFFAASLRKHKSIMEDVYEGQPDAKPLTPEMKQYFRFFTWVMVIYFGLKAIAYLVIARNYTIEQLLIFRFVVGKISLVVLIGLLALFGRPLFNWLQKRGAFKPTEKLP